MNSFSHQISWIGALLVMFMLGTIWGVVWAGFAATEAAAVCADPGSPFASGFQGAPNGRGVRVNNPGMTVFDGTQCGRVSSIFVYNSMGTRWVEVGWFEDGDNHYGCLPTTSGPPKELAYWKFDTAEGCLTTPTTPSGGSQHNFSIQDENQNGVWDYRRNTNVIFSSANLSPFVTGLPWNNGERLTNPAGTPHAVFNGMKRMGADQQWKPWTSIVQYLSSDSGAHGCQYSVTYQEVKLLSQPC
jgi:hypothetical protein